MNRPRLLVRSGALLLALMTEPASAAEAPICTDRPTKANAVCTVPAGKVQLEAGAVGWSLTKGGGSRTERLMLGSSLVKVGLTSRSDLQLGFTPYLRSRAKQDSVAERRSGFGDVLVRYKYRLTLDSAPVQAGVIPFVILPTARKGLGSGKVEGGIAVSVSFVVSGPVTVTFGPELDLLADEDGRGRHVALVNVVNISTSIAPRLTVAGEIWTNFNFDRGTTAKQASADAAVAYAVAPSLQLDAGVNLGLTRETADVEAYAGLSIRF